MGWAVAPLVSLAISAGSQLLLGLFQKSPKQKDPSLQVPKSDYGVGIPKIYGRVRLEGNKFFPQTKELMYEIRNERSSSGGKGGGRSNANKEKKVYGSIALLYCQGQTTLEKIIIQGEHIGLDHPFFQQYCTWFDGTQDTVWSVVSQDADPYKFIKYKDVAYLGIEKMPLDRYGNQIPAQVSAILTDTALGYQPTLTQVVGDMLTRAGIDSALWDVTDLSTIQLKDGIVVRQSGESYRESIESLMELYLFAPYRDTNGKIVFRRIRRGDGAVTSLSNKYFIANEDEGSYITEIKSDFELPTKLSVKFFNNSRNYESDEVNVFLNNKAEKDNNVKSISETLTTFPYEAEYRGREILSYLYSQEKNSYTFKLPIWYYSQFNCLDVVTLPNGQTVQITKINVGADYTVEITANYYDSIASAYVSTPDTAITPPVLTDPPIPDIFIIDAPVIDNDIPGSLYCFATSGPATIEVSDNGGNSWDVAVSHLYASVIGNCLNTLGTTVNVELISGNSLESITVDEFNVDMGQNLCFIGKQTADGYYEGEFLQYQDATVIGTKQYTLSTLKRGLNNTGYYQHQAGEKFFLFKGVGSYYSVISGNASFIGLPLLFRSIVSDWQNLATTPTVGITGAGNAYKPPASSNLTGIIDIEGNIKMFWDYENKFSPFNNSQQQESITFEVDVLSGITPVRTIASSEKNAIYTVLERTADGIPTSFDVTIYAVSSVVGRGFPYTATLVPVLVEDSIFSTGEGITGIKFIYANYTVTEADLSYVLVIVNPSPTTITLTFPPHSSILGEPDLSNGFFCYIISQKTNNNLAIVELIFDFTYTGLFNNFITTGNSARVFHISEGKYFVFGNSTNKVGYENNVVNITGAYQLESNTVYEVIAPATLTFPSDPVRGDLIHLVDSPGTFREDNLVTLNGNGYTIEGSASFVLDKRDENIQFYFNGSQWVYISRFFYLDYRDIYPLLVDGNNVGFPIVEVDGELKVQIPMSTAEEIDDRVAQLLVAGTNITLDYNDTANTITINSTGGGGGSTDIVDIWLYSG